MKDSLRDADVAAYWTWTLNEVVPALQQVAGIRSVKLYAGAGGLRADIRYVCDMDPAGVYERWLTDPLLRPVPRCLACAPAPRPGSDGKGGVDDVCVRLRHVPKWGGKPVFPEVSCA